MRVDTPSGAVIGAVRDGVARFYGIPFAAPATGVRRFAHPQPAQPWREPLAAIDPRPAPPQSRTVGPGIRGAYARTSEDCLHLNVFAPLSAATPLPVVVWIFGGGYINGDAADPLFDGTHLAGAEQLVVVTINYRLGVWGFAPLRDRNVGLADQIAALHWISTHIGAFGGDPLNVTIVGESAGAMSVCNLLACPAARGTFHCAIAQSGAADHVGTRAESDTVAAIVREELAMDPSDADVDALLRAQQATIERVRAHHRGNYLRPHVDGELLPRHPFEAARAGATVPLIIGINRDEYRLYLRSSSLKVSDQTLAAHVEKRLLECGVQDVAGATTRLLGHYHSLNIRTRYPNAERLCAIETELRFRDPMLRYATVRGSNTWVYQFDWPSPALRGWLGATHAVEIPFVFGNFELRSIAKFVGASPEATALSDRIMALWAHFARHGSPPDAWRPFSSDARMQLHLDRAIECRRVDTDPTVRLWDEILGR
jgi:para-nitrobenzyl esterase